MQSNELHRSIHGYNSVFTFTSMGSIMDKNLANMNDGMHTFEVQEQVHHYFPTLYPTDDQSRFLNLYDMKMRLKENSIL